VTVRTRRAVLSFAALLAFVLPAASAEPISVTDATGRTVTISDTSRIVSIGGAVTEILYAVGAADRVVARDDTSLYPPQATEKPSIGYVRALTAEGVLSLSPSVVIAVKGAGPKETIDVLEKASVPFVLVPDDHTAEGVGAKIRIVAAAAGVAEKGEVLAKTVEEDLASFAAMRDKITTRRKAVFVLGMSGGSATVAGAHTSADAIFALASVDNALSAMQGFKPASDEAALASNPDAVVIMAERGHALTPDVVFALPVFADTPAAKEKRLISMSGNYLLGFGPRTAHAARDLAAAIYPELALPALPERPWTAKTTLGKAD
jgi:iron complex transport system substrate-binding protein